MSVFYSNKKAHSRQAEVGQVDDSLGSGRGPGYRRFASRDANQHQLLLQRR